MATRTATGGASRPSSAALLAIAAAAAIGLAPVAALLAVGR